MSIGINVVEIVWSHDVLNWLWLQFARNSNCHRARCIKFSDQRLWLCLFSNLIFTDANGLSCSGLAEMNKVALRVPAIIMFEIHYRVWMPSQLRHPVQWMANYTKWISQEYSHAALLAKHAVIIIRNNLSNQWSAIRARANCKWYRQAKCHIKYWWPL